LVVFQPGVYLMLRFSISSAGLIGVLTLGLAGCIRTHSDVVIHQPKPMVVDVNLSGTLTLVVKDARDDMQYITGHAPGGKMAGGSANPAIPVVDIPSTTQPTTKAAGGPSSSRLRARGLTAAIFADANAPVGKSAILRQLRADYPKVRALLDAHLVGEAHTGYMVARAHLSAQQARFVSQDNVLRRELYQAVAAETGQSMAQVGLSYYVVRLRYLAKGVWVQAKNRANGQWVWIHWHG
jgi:uncharacterized protein YdbL (DUF1318 family)